MSHTAASFSPVSLSYVAALRGVTPRRPGQPFMYAQTLCATPEFLMAMAASNPEGHFYGLIVDTALHAKAVKDAALRQLRNITFLNSSIEQTLTAVKSGTALLPPLDYLVYDHAAPLPEKESAVLYDMAAVCLKPGGLFCAHRPSMGDPTANLAFLVREFLPEMNEQQTADFLLDIKKLGVTYLRAHIDMASRLDQAIVANKPAAFFDMFKTAKAHAASFDAVVAAAARGMTYAGDACIPANYIELSVPLSAQNILDQCRANPLYESLKDFATQSDSRTDIWIKQPAPRTADVAELFGSFAYGLAVPGDKVPAHIEGQGKTIDLSGSLMQALVKMMDMQPVGIGDFLQSPAGWGMDAADVVGALQILVAVGVARPMRGAREALKVSSVAQPRFCGSFNRYIDSVPVTDEDMLMASRVMGDVVTISPREALVMQALNRAGLVNSVSALVPELERLAEAPAMVARITDADEPASVETARKIISDTINESIVHWYAYGLLEAA